ncbi:hypothetical protein NP233_g8282 [Leucocoprinus birnbaumii]|uniref:Uncharacterized protein n=1 Tax=Leucocoprinus birnbaumii TaxID=56174 RepID=A0AAD5YP74_9AGAR|nr:hypothetical protein NP233_g8282 [Leucocoprinus birnbaumii]
MSTVPHSPRSGQLEVDVITEYLEQFYPTDVRSDSGTAEEQEDVHLYNLYDSRTPKPSLKSPKSHHQPPLNPPIDHDALTQKLRSHMETKLSGDKIDSRLGVCEERQGPNVSIKMAETGRGGL